MIQDWHRTATETAWKRFGASLSSSFTSKKAAAAFEARFRAHGPRLIDAMYQLYGWQHDFYWHLEALLKVAADAAATRPADLVKLDESRDRNKIWLADNSQLGAIAYVDRFAGDLNGVAKKIPYLKELGVTYLHLMPLFAVPDGPNDGGYAVTSYRDVRSDLGSMTDLQGLARNLRKAGISLVVDFILNHTADNHAWAEAAKAGDPAFQDFFWMFDDRTIPNRYQPNLRAIFPDRGGDSFTWRTDVKGENGGKWVWTTFYTFQWDLNYRNPALLTAMCGEMLFLANQGIEVLRMDAVPFLWKELGTTCENRPEGHLVMQVYNAMAALAAPSLVFKSEAIVHPDDVAKWVTPEECQISYNPLIMALTWDAVATGKALMLRDALTNRWRLPVGTSWVNYLRCHDDIGWGFANEDAVRLGIEPEAHRTFLNAWYTNRFSGSTARGLPFQENEETGDCRICGMLASLSGLEAALEGENDSEIETAIRRVVSLHGFILFMGGLPLIYLGDEIGMLNDYDFADDPDHAMDQRWLHRPRYDWARNASAKTSRTSPEARVFTGLKALVAIRKENAGLAGPDLDVVPLPHDGVVAFRRGSGVEARLVIVSFARDAVAVPASLAAAALGAAGLRDLVTQEVIAGPIITIPSAGIACLAAV
jgi:amylosucrase